MTKYPTQELKNKRKSHVQFMSIEAMKNIYARRGNYVQTYEDSAMRAYKQKVKAYLRKAKPELIEKGAIFAHVTFYVPAHISIKF